MPVSVHVKSSVGGREEQSSSALYGQNRSNGYSKKKIVLMEPSIGGCSSCQKKKACNSEKKKSLEKPSFIHTI